MKRVIRKDGLTSEERKKKYSFFELREFAQEAYKYFNGNGWEPLTRKNIYRLKAGTDIRCCEFYCGCFGQIEKIVMGEKEKDFWDKNFRRIYHTNHEDQLGYRDVSESDGDSEIDIEFGLIRTRK